jgi:hypothetical protein
VPLFNSIGGSLTTWVLARLVGSVSSALFNLLWIIALVFLFDLPGETVQLKAKRGILSKRSSPQFLRFGIDPAFLNPFLSFCRGNRSDLSSPFRLFITTAPRRQCVVFCKGISSGGVHA